MKIAAVVVTYNRLNLLKECIEALRNQTCKLDEIFVINNSSTDGTFKWLSEQKDLTVVTQPNSGGAGGFHTGMKKAYEAGYDWIWLMDDDCLPDKIALKELSININEFVGVLNCVVLISTNQEELAFGLEDYLKHKYFKKKTDIEDSQIIYGGNFFNGTLFSREIYAIIGNIIPEFFVSGDEVEYFLRIRRAGYNIKTIPSSILLTPYHKYVYLGKNRFFYRFNFYSTIAAKYFPRNIFALCFIYKDISWKRVLKHYLFDLYGLLFVQKNLRIIIIYLFSILKGPYFSWYLLKKNSEN